MSATQQTRWPPGHVLLDDFEVERHLGAGGMGDVCLVRSRSTGERFAVKRVLPKYTEDDRHGRDFPAELRTWQDLPDHPNLAACRFFRTIHGQTCIFAEYVEGGSLEDWIRAGKLDDLDKMLDVAIQFAWGLDAAHRCGLVHQDVKPGNVLVTPDGVPKVTDFGLAKVRARVEESAEVAQAPRPARRSLFSRFFGAAPVGETVGSDDESVPSDTARLESVVSCGG